MSNALAVVRQDIEKMVPRLAETLPAHIAAERFKSVALSAVTNNPDIANCDRSSIMSSFMKCAQDGLLPDGREAAIVKFGNRAQYMPMVAGILKKVRNSGDLASISAHVVYSADEFAYELGDNERILHRPVLENRGKQIAVYAIATLTNGEKVREVMSATEVERVRKASRGANAGPWVQWWDEMAKKTVIRRLSKRLPMSSDLDSMVRDDPAFHAPATTEKVINPVDALNAEISEPAPEQDMEPPKRQRRTKTAEQTLDVDPETGELQPQQQQEEVF